MLLNYLEKLAKVKVLIFDAAMIIISTIQQLGMLADIFEERDGRASIIVTTQYPPDKWHDHQPDPTIADAICDRLTHTAFRFDINYESPRKQKSKSQ